MTQHEHGQRICALLRGRRLRISNEYALQASIADWLTENGVEFSREARLSVADRPDFLCGDVVIEAKARYGKRAIYRQLERYANHAQVGAIVLVTGTAMGMPPTIAGKPVYIVQLGLAFL